MVLGVVHIDVEHLGELGCGDDDCAGIGKSVYYRMGKKIYNQSQPENSQGKLENSDNERKQDGISYETLGFRQWRMVTALPKS